MDLVSNRQRIARWLQALMAEIGDEYTPKLALRHITINDRQNEIGTFAPQKLGDDEGVFGDLVRRLGEAIDTDAEGLGGVQRYLLIATVDDHVVGRLPLRCAAVGAMDGETDSIESEPPTTRGQVAQQMRHNEALMRMFVVGMGQVVSTMQRTIVRLQQTSESADERRLEAVETTEKLLSEDNDRKIALSRAAYDKEIQASALGTFGKGLTTALGILADKGGGGHFVKALKELLGTITPDQYDKLIGLFSPEQLALVERLFGAKLVGDPSAAAEAATAAAATAAAAAGIGKPPGGGGAPGGTAAAPWGGRP